MAKKSVVSWTSWAAVSSGSSCTETNPSRDSAVSDHLSFRTHSVSIRRKRSVSFPSGVKLCPQETFDQAINNHSNFFHRRVCQETVWEAFKIFWDQSPDRDQYQAWVNRCIDGSVSIKDIGSFFSQSDAHQSLIRSRVVSAAAMNSVHISSDSPSCRSEVSVQTEQPAVWTQPGDDGVVIGSEAITVRPDKPSPGFQVTSWTPPPSLATEAPPKEAAETSLPGNPVDLTSDTAADTLPLDSNDIQKTVPSITSQSSPEVIGNVLNVGVTSEETVEVTTEVFHPVTHSVDQEIGTGPGGAEQQEVELVESDQILHTVTEVLDTMHVVRPEDGEPPTEEAQDVLTEAAVVVLPQPTFSPAVETSTSVEYDDLPSQITPVVPEGVGIEDAPETTSRSFVRPKPEEISDNSLDTSPEVPSTVTLTERPSKAVPESVVEAVALTPETPSFSGSTSDMDKAKVDDPSEAAVEVPQDKTFSTETTPTVFSMIEPEDEAEVTINEIPEQESGLDVTSQASISMSTREMVAEVSEATEMTIKPLITIEETTDEEAEIPTTWMITEETIKERVLVSTAKPEDSLKSEVKHEGTIISTEDTMVKGETVQTEEPTIRPIDTEDSAEEQVEASEKKFTAEEPVKGQAETHDSIVEGGYTLKAPLEPKEQDGHEHIEEPGPSEDPTHESEPIDEAEPPGTDAKKPEIVEKTQTEPAEDTMAETVAHEVEIELEALEREEHSAEPTTELTSKERHREASPGPTDKASGAADVKEPRTELAGGPAQEPKATGEPTQEITLLSDITETEPTIKSLKETEPEPKMEIPGTVVEAKLTDSTTRPEQFTELTVEPQKETQTVIKLATEPKDEQVLTEQNPNPEGSVKPAQEINPTEELTPEPEPTPTHPLERKPAEEIKTIDKPVTMRPTEPTPEPEHVPQLTTESSQQTDPSITQENQESTGIPAEGLSREPSEEPEPTQEPGQEPTQITEPTQGTQQTFKPKEDQRPHPTRTPEETDSSTEITQESETSEEPTPEAEAAEEQPGVFEEPTQGHLPTEQTHHEVESIREPTQDAKVTVNPAQEPGHTGEPTQTEPTETTEEPPHKTKLEQEIPETTKMPASVPKPRTESADNKDAFEEKVEPPQLTGESGQEPEPTGEPAKELESEPPSDTETSKDPNLHEEPSSGVENPTNSVMETEFPKEMEPTAEPTKETETAAEPEKETEPTTEPTKETETAAEPEKETESTEPEKETETAEPEKETEPTEPTKETETAAEPEKETEPTTEPATETETAAEPEKETETATEPEKETEPATETEPTTEPAKETETAEPTKETETAESAKETDLTEQPKRKPEPTSQPTPGELDEPAGNMEPTEAFTETGPSLRPGDDGDEAGLPQPVEPFKQGEDKSSETSDEGTKIIEGTKDVPESLVPQAPEKDVTPAEGPEDSQELMAVAEMEGTSGQDGAARSPHGSEDHVPPETLKETSSHEVGPAITETENVPEGEDPRETSPEVVTKALPGTRSEEGTLKAEDRPTEKENVTSAVLPAANDGDRVTPQTDSEFGGRTTQRTLTVEEATQGSSAKYVVETNNGNFSDSAVPPDVDEDVLSGNNGFVGESEDDNSIGNEIDATSSRPSRPLREHVVESRIKSKGETFNNASRDPSSFEYQQSARQFKRKVEDSFERSPGFKRSDIIEFRPQKDSQRGSVVQVHYAIILDVEVDSGGVSSDTSDFITSQNNSVERNYIAAAEQPTVIYTITDFRNYITEASHKDNFLTNSSLDILEMGNAAPVKPTSKPADTYDNMDNISAAEKPPDAPIHEPDTNDVFSKKEDFLIDTRDPWKGPQGAVVSENDVFLFDESTTPPQTVQVQEMTADLKPVTEDEHGDIEDEGFLLTKPPDAVDNSVEDQTAGREGSPAVITPPVKAPTPSEVTFDHGSGSGFSGDAQESYLWSWDTAETSDVTYDERVSSHEVLPPPDSEMDTDEDRAAVELPTTKTADFFVTVQGSLNTAASQVTVPASENSPLDQETRKHPSDSFRVTPLSTDSPDSTTAQVLSALTEATVTVDVSVQTVEASGFHEDYSSIEPQTVAVPVTSAPEPKSWTPADSSVLHQASTENVVTETEAEILKVTVISESTKDVPKMKHEEVTASPDSPVNYTEAPPTVGLPIYVKVQAITVSESATETATGGPEQLEVSAGKSEPPLPETRRPNKIEISEEQHLGSSHAATTTPSPESLDQDSVVDEVIVVTATTATPVQTSPAASEHSVVLSPEKESPFTRVSDSVPEDEDLFHHDHQNLDEVTDVSTSSPASEISQATPAVALNDTEKAATGSGGQSFGASAPDMETILAEISTGKAEPSGEEARPPSMRNETLGEPVTPQVKEVAPFKHEVKPPGMEGKPGSLVVEAEPPKHKAQPPEDAEVFEVGVESHGVDSKTESSDFEVETLRVKGEASGEEETTSSVVSESITEEEQHLGEAAKKRDPESPKDHGVEVQPLGQHSETSRPEEESLGGTFEPSELGEEVQSLGELETIEVNTSPSGEEVEPYGETSDRNKEPPTGEVVEPSKVEVLRPGEVEPSEEVVEPSKVEVLPHGELEPSTVEVVEPSKAEMFPHEGEVEPSGEVLEPSKVEVLPPGELEPSTGEVVQPSKVEVLPPGELEPSGEVVEPSKVQVLPHGEVEPSGEVLEPSKVEVLPPGEVEHSTGEVLEPSKVEVLPPGEVEPSTGEVVEPSKAEIFPHEGEVEPSGEVVEPSKVELLPPGELEHSTGEVLEPSKVGVLPPGEVEGTSVVNIQHSTEEVSISPSGGDVSGKVETRPSSGEVVSGVHPIASSSHPKVNNSSSEIELQSFDYDFSDMPSIDVSIDSFQYGPGEADGESSGFSSEARGSDLETFQLPGRPGRASTVFFSLRVTNMAFSMNLFNKSSSEYKSLEQRFLQSSVPYLQSNSNNFQNLEILNFRNGSIVVNSRMRFGKPVRQEVTNIIYSISEDFANTAYQTMNSAIDKYSLDVESGDRADPCKFQACNEFSKCMVNQWSGEAECVCDAGFSSIDGSPCQSVCEVQHNFCLNDGKCDIIPGKGAICRCRVGENWWYRGEHCEEYVSEPLVVGIAIASVVGFLSVAGGIIFFSARTLREQYDGEDTEDPLRRHESVPTLERATKFNPMFESDPVTAQYYRRYGDSLPQYHQCCDSTPPQHCSKDLTSEEIQNICQNTTSTKEEIQERSRIIELCSRDQRFADFVRQTQVFSERRGSSTT